MFSQICDLYKEYPGYIVLINVGSFYELYFEQAYNYSKLLNINLVSKKIAGNKYNIPFSGFPTFQLSKFLNIIIKEHNMKAVIVDQIDDKIDPKNKIINRKVTRIITPGTFIEDALQHTQENVFTAAIHFNEKNNKIGFSWTDLSTGELYSMSCDKQSLQYHLQRINPQEVIVLKDNEINEDQEDDDDANDFFIKKLIQQDNGNRYFVSSIPKNGTYTNTSIKSFDFIFSLKERKQFNIIINKLDNEQVNSLKILLYYLHTQFPNMLSDPENSNINLNLPISISNSKVLRLDSLTIKSLELYETMARNSTVGTLFNHLSKNITNASSARLLKNWISQPITDIDLLNERYDIIQFFQKHGKHKVELINFLKQLKDMSKILQQIAISNGGNNTVFQFDSNGGTNNIKNLYNLCECLNNIDYMRDYLLKAVPENETKNKAFLKLINDLKYDDIDSIKNVLTFIDSDVIMDETELPYEEIEAEESVNEIVNETVSNTLFNESFYFKNGFDETLDDLVEKYQNYLAQYSELNKKLKDKFVNDLKMKSIEFKNTMSKGFHLEINSGTAKNWKNIMSDPKLNKFQKDFPILNKSSNKKVKNLNLLYSEEWAELGEKLIITSNKIKQRNNQLIKSIQQKMIRESSSQIRTISTAISKIDILIAFTEFSDFHDLTRPNLTKNNKKTNTELYLPEMKNFQLTRCKPNTVKLSPNKFQIITGSNKSGKSNYLKSICYSVILAQIGCFVPTSPGANIPIYKQLSYKSQAMDDINQGVSGFAFETLQIVDLFRELQPKNKVEFVKNVNEDEKEKESDLEGSVLLIFDEFNKCTHWKESLGLTYTYLKQLHLWNSEHSNNLINVISSLHLGGELGTYLEQVDPDLLKNGLEFWKFELIKDKYPLKQLPDNFKGSESLVQCDKDEKTDHITEYKTYKYDYTLKPGISTKSDALKVCYEFGYPSEVLNLAEKSIHNVWKVFK
ncbi:hypothetical protein ACO0SA_001521 [Hanseniaspora valbyensis]